MTIGYGLCPECGEEPVSRQRPVWWERLRYWLVNGSKAADSLICANGHEWPVSFATMLFRSSPRWPKWVRVPVELFRVVHTGRSMEPTPMTFVMAIGAGVVLGVVVDLAFDWPWWVIAVGFVSLVWLVFLASAFKGSPDLGRRLLSVIDPEEAARRNIQRLEDALAAGSLAGYELVKWEGEKSIGGWGGGPTPHSLTIRHGNQSDPKWVEVTTHTGDAADTMGHWVREDLEIGLVAAHFPLPPHPTIEDFQRRQRDTQQARPPQWHPVWFRVAGEMIPGEVARIGSNWAGLVRVGAVALEMTGAGVDPAELELSPIVTLDPYTKDRD